MSFNMNTENLEEEIDLTTNVLIGIKKNDYISNLKNNNDKMKICLVNIIDNFDNKITTNIKESVNDQLTNIIFNDFENTNYCDFEKEFAAETIKSTTSAIDRTIKKTINDPQYINKYNQIINKKTIDNNELEKISNEIDWMTYQINKEVDSTRKLSIITCAIMAISGFVGLSYMKNAKNLNNCCKTRTFYI